MNYVKNIFHTENILLFEYNEWSNRVEVVAWKDKYGFDPKFFDPLFANSFLRQRAFKMIESSGSIYKSVVSSRPDVILTIRPPDYFFDGSEKIWHQRNNLIDIIYSTFFSSNQSVMEKVCNFYTSDLINDSINSPHNRYNNRLEHCGVMYSYIKLLNLIEDTYNGTLFAEPFRTTDTLNIENIKNNINESVQNLGMDFHKNWFPLFEN